MSKALPTGGGFIDPDFPNPHGAGDARIIIYGYTPNFTLCVLGTVFFSFAFLVHLLQALRYRLWSFIPLTVACFMEVLGYIFRALSSRKDPYRISYFVAEYFLIVTAPVLISASIYVCLTHILAWAETSSAGLGRNPFLRKKLILWTFVTIDVLTTIMQVTGAGMIGGATSKQKDPTTANDVLLAGLAIQSFAFFIYLVLLVFVIISICQDEILMGKLHTYRSPFIAVLTIASILVCVRTIFRLVETSQGVFGYLSTHEAFFGGLEFAPVVLAVWILALWHPGRWPSRMQRKTENLEA